MALRESDVRVVKPSPATEAEARRKADFDSSMVLVRHHVKFADHDAAEYFYREILREAKSLSLRFGFKGLA